MATLGQLIAQARKQRQLSQKELAKLVERDDGKSIAPQYLNDIEHDRRTPSDYILEQLAKVLQLGTDLGYMYYLIGKWPVDLRQTSIDAQSFRERIRIFRRGRENRGKAEDDLGD